MERPEYFFVYGTLLAEAGHPMSAPLAEAADEVGRGSIQARIYIIHEEDAQGPNSYPGAVPSPFPEDQVHGVLYRVHTPNRCLAFLTTTRPVQKAGPNPTNSSYDRLTLP